MWYLNFSILKRLDEKCSNAGFCTSLAGQRVLILKCRSDPPDVGHLGDMVKLKPALPSVDNVSSTQT